MVDIEVDEKVATEIADVHENRRFFEGENLTHFCGDKKQVLF